MISEGRRCVAGITISNFAEKRVGQRAKVTTDED